MFSRNKYSLFLLAFCLLFFQMSCMQTSRMPKNETDLVWDKIKPYFSPHEDYVNNYGDYRSPLKFYNRDTVKTMNDWQLRRKEIREEWMSMLGEWPPILENQQLEITHTVDKESYLQHTVRFYWTPNEQTEGYLLAPKIKGKKPAVITVFYEPETSIGEGKPDRDFAYQLVRRGFVCLLIGTKLTSSEKVYSIYYPNRDNTNIQPLSTLAYAVANAWQVLAKVNDVDSIRIGIVGHSYVGKWAMFASCLYDKFACAAWSHPRIVFDETKGAVNYWEPWYLGYYPPPWKNVWRKTGLVEGAKGLYPYLQKNGYDLHELHALMAPRPFLVSGGSSDPVERWIPLNHTIAVNRVLGYDNRVAMTNRTLHEPNPESNIIIYDFFDYFLKY
jgi:dienelactone hydrolase